jgi:glycosyltransferase involved in cell wall biosynthesis
MSTAPRAVSTLPAPTEPLVSVVIPTYNRADLLGRALRSVQAQTHAPLETIVVDDASTDPTPQVIRAFEESCSMRIVYIRHAERRNGGAARNSGILAARGDYVAFLDSDDEWLPNHLSRKLEFIRTTGAEGAFGSFYIARSSSLLEYRCAERHPAMPMSEYILSSIRGDARTSTFVFRKDPLRAILFDETLEKHQDWDLAIRFSARFQLTCEPSSTVIIHANAERRMSFTMNHVATERFMRCHGRTIARRSLARTYVIFARRTREAEGRNEHFAGYMRLAAKNWSYASLRDKITILALSVPISDRIFLRLGRLYLRFERSIVALARRMRRREWRVEVPTREWRG